MLFLILPAYNEEKDLPPLLERVHSAMASAGLAYRVLLVNDGSTDGTLTAARRFAGRMPIEVLEHGGNKGLGQAMRTGLERAAALAAPEDVVAAMDADNTHDPELLAPMLAQIAAGSDVVIASRYAPGGREVGLSRARHIFSGGASSLLRLFFPIRGARDYTCGFRAYRAGLLQRAMRAYGPALIEEHGFTCMAELLIKLGKLGARVSEVPLVLRYDLKSGPSKMKVLRTIARYGVLIGRNWLRAAPPAVQAAQEG